MQRLVAHAVSVTITPPFLVHFVSILYTTWRDASWKSLDSWALLSKMLKSRLRNVDIIVSFSLDQTFKTENMLLDILTEAKSTLIDEFQVFPIYTSGFRGHATVSVSVSISKGWPLAWRKTINKCIFIFFRTILYSVEGIHCFYGGEKIFLSIDMYVFIASHYSAELYLRW